VQRSDNRPEFVYAIGDGRVLPKGTAFADFSAGLVFPRPLIIGTTKNENNAWNATWPSTSRKASPWRRLSRRPNRAVAPITVASRSFSTHWRAQPRHVQAELQIRDRATRRTRYVSRCPDARPPSRIRSTCVCLSLRLGSDPNKHYKIPNEDAWVFYKGAIHVAESDFFYQTFFGRRQTLERKHTSTRQRSGGPEGPFPGHKGLPMEFLHDPHGRIAKGKGQQEEWRP